MTRPEAVTFQLNNNVLFKHTVRTESLVAAFEEMAVSNGGWLEEELSKKRSRRAAMNGTLCSQPSFNPSAHPRGR